MEKQKHEIAESEAHYQSHFDFSVIDDAIYLRDSYALRYEVYCHERGFLAPENYPLKLETDPYDDRAIHVGGINKQGVMAGTVRLVLPSEQGFPLLEHCKLFHKYQYLVDPDNFNEIGKTLYEVVVNNSYNSELVEKRYNRALKFSWTNTAKDLMKVFKSL